MASELCPNCRQLRNLRATITTRSETSADGKKRKIKTTSYACEICHRFVRSEEQAAG
ncbi:MAG: hypothetical protein ACYDCO_03770 [Armatimonadota bacterium]